MACRHQQLEDSLKLHQFLHDVEDEQTWMREREPLASDTDLGNTLTSVQILLKKHKVCVYTLAIQWQRFTSTPNTCTYLTKHIIISILSP